jgi:AP-4 complex subunit mu-1
MWSQFFILSPRGDTIITKDFRGDALPNLHEIFFRKVKFWFENNKTTSTTDAPPIFMIDGITFAYIKRNSLLIVCTSKFNISPSLTLELLNRLAKVFKDYCGILTEESIRKNFVLIYELLDEMIDYGYPQITSTELLKNCVHNEAIIINNNNIISPSSMLLSMNISKTKSSAASNIPVSVGLNNKNGNKGKNEIYVDIIEKITVLFNANGYIVNSSIDGSIQMKSFLSGNPELRLALNEDLVIGKGSGAYGSVILDDCNFHECVHLDEFESSRTLHFIPPDGEFAVLNYRITTDFRCPFKIFPTLEETNPMKLELLCLIRTDIPDGSHATNVTVKIPLPRCTINATIEMNSDAPGFSAEYNNNEKKIIWNMKKVVGGSEMSIRVKITTDQVISTIIKREVGPISMGFEIPMHNVSNLQVKYLRISETHKSYNPFRWVRYITTSSSYVARLA